MQAKGTHLSQSGRLRLRRRSVDGRRRAAFCRTDNFKDLDLDVLIEGYLFDDAPDGGLKAILVAHDRERVGDVDQRHCADDKAARGQRLVSLDLGKQEGRIPRAHTPSSDRCRASVVESDSREKLPQTSLTLPG